MYSLRKSRISHRRDSSLLHVPQKSGLVYGNALMGFPFTVHIISVEDTKPVLIEHIENTIKEIEEITGLAFEFEVDKAADIVDKYMGDGWSCNTPESENEVLEFVRTEGIYIENVYATVVKKDVAMEKNVPGKVVHTHKLVYGVQFLTEDNQTVEYSVPEELYDYIYIGQKGILSTVDGEFFDFGEGENI